MRSVVLFVLTIMEAIAAALDFVRSTLPKFRELSIQVQSLSAATLIFVRSALAPQGIFVQIFQPSINRLFSHF